MRLPIVTLLVLSMVAGCRAVPVPVMREVVEAQRYRSPTERPVDAWRHVVLQLPSMVSPLVRIHRVIPSRGAGIGVTDGGWIDRPIFFLPGTVTFNYTCADGKGGENAELTFVRAGSYTLDCAQDGSLVAIGPRAPAF